MLARAPSTLLLRALRAQISSRPTRCFCASKKSLNGRTRRVALSFARCYSEVAPVTSVGATKTIPPRLKALHEELTELGKEAANYVNLSQLQLALRGLESEDPTIRIAVLGVSGIAGARRLVSALLADPLSNEKLWESRLKELKRNGKAVMLRYGEDFKIDDQHALLTTMSIPSRILERQKLELLICETNAGSATNQGGGLQNLLVPNLATPISNSGRLSVVAYPVHKTLVYGRGMEGARGVFNLVQPGSEANDPRVLGVVDVPWRADKTTDTTNVIPVDLTEAEKALAKIRGSVSKATAYEHGWISSNLSAVTPFLSIATDSSTIKPAVGTLIETILNSTLESLRSSQDSLRSVPTTGRSTALDDLLSSWSVSSHTELRDSLDGAFHSRSWAKLAWWKLPWRVDDISLIIPELLQRAYLPLSEKGLIYVSGCLHQEGLLTGESTGSTSTQAVKDSATGSLGQVPTPDQISAITSSSVEDRPTSVPWPTIISTSRQSLLQTIPTLQANAQSLMLRFLTTNALGSSIAALAYVGVSSTTAYEAGAVASFAFVWAARDVQKGWEKNKKDWVDQVKTEGRRALITGETWARQLVSKAAKDQEQKQSEELGGPEESVVVEDRIKKIHGMLESVARSD